MTRTFVRLILRTKLPINEIISDVEEELQIRNWDDLQVSSEPEVDGVVVVTSREGKRSRQIAVDLQEELAEVGSAVFSSINGMRVDIVSVEVVEDPSGNNR